ncbi:MAG TPA: hypothetical protein VF171_02640, partial [Trueperaceae bacterium]
DEGVAPLALFAASLTQADPGLLAELTDALGEVARLQADPDGSPRAVTCARALLERAQAALTPLTLRPQRCLAGSR